MVQNSTQSQNSSSEELILRSLNPLEARVRMATVQVLVWFFLYINGLMHFTFLSKQAFWGNTRYVLFAHTLLLNSIFLLLTDLVVLLTYFFVMMPMGFCILLCIIMESVTSGAPFTITAMCLERYVAICMPLRHANISTPDRAVAAIVVISIFSLINPFMDLFVLIAMAPPGYFAEASFCHYEIMLVAKWQRFTRALIYQVDLAVIAIIIMFCYVKIMLAAKAASGGNKESVSKGRRTLLFHSLQLFLCMIDILCPYFETYVLENSPQNYLTIRFFNYTAFTIISRALSALIYGLRDKTFCVALVYYVSCKMNQVTVKKSNGP
ncbi:odorant receptor 131-2-like [Megalops cyprinoides]|uniref:odorant receptor 131-2-like n=1 Tax=Megalops cyprinoides TaxID=118141 RepID=UPI0018656ADE|nr:odorant receptor 131-2-like [Megalops cyprinoides]